MGIGTGRGVGLSVELNRVAFDNMLRAVVEVRFVDGQDEGADTVATVRRCYGIAIDTGLRECLSVEPVTASFTHRIADGIECRLVDNQLQAVEQLRAVRVVRRIVAV